MRLEQGSSTHETRLERHHEGVSLEVPGPACPGCSAQRDDLGMSCRIGRRLAAISTLPDDRPGLVDDHRTDRNLARVPGLPGQLERAAHRGAVGVSVGHATSLGLL